jgi:hypothetical protein
MRMSLTLIQFCCLIGLTSKLPMAYGIINAVKKAFKIILSVANFSSIKE